MTGALLVLNPREITECVAAIEALPIEKCWLSYMTELHAAEHFNAMVRHTAFDRYLIQSDDSDPSPECLAKVLELHDAGHPVVTGYCNVDESLPFVNLTRGLLREPPPVKESYDLLTQADVDAFGEELVPSTFCGFSLTCMSRDMWLRYPLTPTILGGQMDYQMSWSLQRDGVPIVSHRRAWMRHWKRAWSEGDQTPGRHLLVGLRSPEIRWSA